MTNTNNTGRRPTMTETEFAAEMARFEATMAAARETATKFAPLPDGERATETTEREPWTFTWSATDLLNEVKDDFFA